MEESFLNWTQITTQAPNKCSGPTTCAKGGVGAASVGPAGHLKEVQTNLAQSMDQRECCGKLQSHVRSRGAVEPTCFHSVSTLDVCSESHWFYCWGSQGSSPLPAGDVEGLSIGAAAA